MISDIVRLKHILDAIHKIERYSKYDRSDSIVLDAIIYQLAIIGEAVRNLTPNLRKHNPTLPWKEIVGLRNLIIHEYFILKHENLWSIVDRDIQNFTPEIEAILKNLET